MQRIGLWSLQGQMTVLEQSLPGCRFNTGDIVKDLSCIFSPPPLYVVVGFTRDLKGEPELLWYTRPSFLIPNSNGGGFEIRVRPVFGSAAWINHTLGNSNFPWLKVVERHPKSPHLSKRDYFSSCLKVLRTCYNLY